MLSEMFLRGYNKSFDEECFICKKKLGYLRDTILIPDTDNNQLKEFSSKRIHRNCWSTWNVRDAYVNEFINNYEVSEEDEIYKNDCFYTIFNVGEYIDSSYGFFCMPRSTVLFKLGGVYVEGEDYSLESSCIYPESSYRWYTPNLLCFLEKLVNGQLKEGADFFIESYKISIGEEIPEMHIKCYNYSDEYLEVFIQSSSKRGINQTLFLYKEDIELMKKESLGIDFNKFKEIKWKSIFE
jgi:hypothetical protein